MHKPAFEREKRSRGKADFRIQTSTRVAHQKVGHEPNLANGGLGPMGNTGDGFSSLTFLGSVRPVLLERRDERIKVHECQESIAVDVGDESVPSLRPFHERVKE